jgi:hypothetical protein
VPEPTEAGAVSVGKAQEVGLPHGTQHLHGCPLDDLVFQRGDADGSLFAVRFGDVRPFDRLGPVLSLRQTIREVLEIALQILPVCLPRLPVDARCDVPLARQIRFTQAVNVVDVVPERGEPHLLIPTGYLSYPFQRTVQVLVEGLALVYAAL